MTEPLLVIDRIVTTDQAITAELRIGGHADRLVLGTEVAGLLTHEYIPEFLHHDGSEVRQAIIREMERCYRGEVVSLPCDLTSVVRASFEAWPARPTGNLQHGKVDQRIVSVSRIDRDPAHRDLVIAHLTLRGAPAVVELKAASPSHAVRFRFVSGVHPWQLTADDADQMLLALVSTLRQ